VNKLEYPLIGETVLNEEPSLARLDETGASQDLKVLGGVCDAERSLLGEGLDGTWTLAQQLEQLDALGRGHGFTDPGKLTVYVILHIACMHEPESIQVIN